LDLSDKRTAQVNAGARFEHDTGGIQVIARFVSARYEPLNQVSKCRPTPRCSRQAARDGFATSEQFISRGLRLNVEPLGRRELRTVKVHGALRLGT
jgi:hypothetical protein